VTAALTLWRFICATCGTELRPPELHPRWAQGGSEEDVSHGLCASCFDAMEAT
jgi:hypothetical protein